MSVLSVHCDEMPGCGDFQRSPTEAESDDETETPEDTVAGPDTASPGKRMRRKTATLNFLADCTRDMVTHFHDDDLQGMLRPQAMFHAIRMLGDRTIAPGATESESSD